MSVGLSEIARRSGVSEATVSRVLNGKAGVSAKTRERVLTIVDSLGYERPSKLGARKNSLVGVISPTLEDPLTAAFVTQIEQELRARQLIPMLFVLTSGGLSETDYVNILFERSAAGAIFLAGDYKNLEGDDRAYVTLHERSLAFVFIDGSLKNVSSLSVSLDYLGGIRNAVAHLKALGHTRIGLAVGPSHLQQTEELVQGFRAAMRAELGLVDVDGFISRNLPTVEGGAQANSRLLEAGATSIVCASDVMALGAMRSLQAKGFDVPRDVSVMGVGDSVLMGFTNPPLTTLKEPVSAMAAAAVQVLVERIKGSSRTNASYTYLPELIVRGSTGPRRR